MKNVELRSVQDLKKIRITLRECVQFFDEEQDQLVDELFTSCPKAVGMMILNKIHAEKPWDSIVAVYRKQQSGRKKWVQQQK